MTTATGGANLVVDVLPWLALLAGLLIVGAAALYLLKRAFSRPVTPTGNRCNPAAANRAWCCRPTTTWT